MAGCYIRLGQNLRQHESLVDKYHFATISFLNAGTAYAQTAFILREQEIDVNAHEIRINLLVSAAQCYYWAFHNEPNLHKKRVEKRLATNYFEYARNNANLLPDETKDFWFNKIDHECTKLA